MLYSAAGAGIRPPQPARNPPIHQLKARLALRFELAGGRTRMFADEQQPPLRVVRAFPRSDGGSLVHIHNLSGGVVAGDRLSLALNAGPGTVAQVTSTGATRLYRQREGSAESEQHTHIRVGEKALLEYLPDALIPFEGSRYTQRTAIRLAEDATLFWWETLAPGRQAMGETFRFSSLRIRNEIYSPTRPLLIENLLLEPGARTLLSAARMGPYSHSASFYACRVGYPAKLWRELEQKLSEYCGAKSSPGVTIWGATTLVADGIAVRGLSASGREIPSTLAAIWNIARHFITGENAIVPRKVH